MVAATNLTFVQDIEAPAATIYESFTNTAAIRGWLCDNAQIDARENGRLYLHWNQGYFAAGVFTEVEAEKVLSFTWHGRNELAPSKVRVEVVAENGHSKVNLVHSGLGTTDDWQTIREGLNKGWETGLANLKSVLETGLDKRIYDRPFMGFFISGLVDEQQAKRLAIPISSGVRIAGTLEGTGAEAAGFEADDILTSIGGVELDSFQAVAKAVAHHDAGDMVDVQFYRGSQKREVSMKLSKRPRPEVPDTAAELASQLRTVCAELETELDGVVSGLSEEQVTHTVEGEWSAKQVITHLILSERALQMNLGLQLGGQIPVSFPTDSEILFAALLTIFPMLVDVVEAWKRTLAETVEMVARLPDDFVARKADFLNMGNSLLLSRPNHTRGHLAQIRKLIEEKEG